jgi:hypothetical protein
MRRRNLSTKLAVTFDVETGKTWRVPIRVSPGQPLPAALPPAAHVSPEDFAEPIILKRPPLELRVAKEGNECL